MEDAIVLDSRAASGLALAVPTHDADRRDDEQLRTSRSLLSGFRMPAEWEPHSGCWMLWPERPEFWRLNAAPAQAAFADVATAISRFEPVTMMTSANQWEAARALLPAAVRVVELSCNDAWARDIAPTFVTRNAPLESGGAELAAIDWTFNAWGGLYDDCALDDLVPAKMCDMDGIKRVRVPVVMEGGSFSADGEGTLLTTQQCLLSPNRNPSLSRARIQAWLCSCLGVSKVIWLPRGLEGDAHTDGHVDNLACFIRPAVVLLAWTDDHQHPQFPVVQEAMQALSSTTDAHCRPITVLKLPLPPPLYFTQQEHDSLMMHQDAEPPFEPGDLLPASYLNFYIANGAIIAPAFGIQESDELARIALQEAFPNREVVMVAGSREILINGGNIHCITQQQPCA